jgi:acyl-homoserine-lactone acylase
MTRIAVWAALFIACLASVCAAPPKGRVEILWDKFGVPHIFAKDTCSAFYAFGWAQMQSHGNLLLRGFGESRGRAAEYWGGQYLGQDRFLHTLGIPKRGRQWYQQQTPEFKRCLDAFAEGINDFAAANAARIPADLKPVLPVDGADPVIHSHRIVHAMVLFPEGNNSLVYANLDGGLNPRRRELLDGSNSWLVGRPKSASGNAMLLANPHRAWSDVFLFYEAHIVAPGVNMYGITHIGFPVLRYSFNDSAGFAQTVNPVDGSDLYRLSLRPSGYLYDGQTRAFETEVVSIRVKEPSGRVRTDSFTVKRSVHGPVVREDLVSALAVRMAGLDRPKMLEQYWRMAQATDLRQFEDALRMMQIPIYTVLYADNAGHILHVFYGLVPDRRNLVKTDWTGVVAGDTSRTLWTRLHSYEELPRMLDPATGFLQNTNDGPVSSTWPFVLDRSKYPDYLLPPRQSLRTSRSLKLLLSEDKISYPRLVELKHNTKSELADRILPDLIPMAEKSPSARIQEAAKVLKEWDRTFESDSRGAVLFEEFGSSLLEGFGIQRAFRVPFDPAKPLETPRGIADPARALALLEQAANEVRGWYRRIDVAFGEVFRFRRGSTDLPAHGGPATLGLFRTFEYQPGRDGRREAYYGDTYVAAVEFSKPLKARVLTGYGNSTQPGSKHLDDQLPLLARKQLRQCLRTRAEVEANLEERKAF